MNDENQSPTSGISTRSVEIVVAVLLFAFGATVVFDSSRLGASWGSDGPQAGYFPFYIGMLICISSVATLAQVLFADWKRREQRYAGAVERRQNVFVAWEPLKQVLLVFLPALVYVLFVQVIGIYVASAVYIALFMVWLGKYSWGKSIAAGVGVMVVVFLMFEVWFKVPLYKGLVNPLAFLGY
jgi:hypothetical protein